MSKNGLLNLLRLFLRRGVILGAILLSSLLAFELFNFSVTQYALTDLIGNIQFAGFQWAMILAAAFCTMDFAGMARLFTPGTVRGESLEVWYLLAAWFLAATMNAVLTWWGISLAMVSNLHLRGDALTVVPVIVAVLVWLVRILIIGMISLSGDRLLTQIAWEMGRPVN